MDLMGAILHPLAFHENHMQFKKFKSLDNEEKRVCLLSGHTYLIGKEWVDIPEFAWDQAYANRCISSDYYEAMTGKEVPERAYIAKEKLPKEEVIERVTKALKEMLEEGNPDNFNGLNNNFPKIGIVRDRSGTDTQATPIIIKKIWEELLEENSK